VCGTHSKWGGGWERKGAPHEEGPITTTSINKLLHAHVGKGTYLKWEIN
jgi:hypothetical protein